MTDLADKFFSAFVHEADPKSIVAYRNASEVFKHVPTDLEAWGLLYGFVAEYNKFPQAEAFEKEVKRELQEPTENAKYWYKQLVKRHFRKSLIRSSQAANLFLKEPGKEVQAFELIEEMVKTTRVNQNSLQLFDYKESHDILKQELANKQRLDYGIQFGWKTLDDMTGGFRGGDMISIVGRPGLGKSMSALAAALHVWKAQKKPVLFVSMEMNQILVLERIAAMDQNIPYNWVKNGQFSTLGIDQRKKYLGKLEALREGNLPAFNVIGGNFSANVEDIAELTRQLEPALVVVDGAYLCKTKENIRKKNDRIDFVCEYLKREVAENCDIPVLPVWQFNRDASKVKKGDKVGLEHIADSDSIPRNSSVVLGLFQEDNAGTIKQRKVQILKGRSGEEGRFNINWDFKKMDFSEVEPIDDEDERFS